VEDAMTTIGRILALAPGLALVLTVTACSGGSSSSETIPPVPAAGTVTYKGKPLKEGTIRFAPQFGKEANGTIVDGKFTMTTVKDGDGAEPGLNLVVIKSVKKGPGGQEVSNIPVRYNDQMTSKLEANLPPEGKTDLTFDVTEP